ncbi:MAG: hypothetical protein J6V89_03590 [Acetobacter sp.]|nr:hypothetical protein [Acetobacter sp.]
MITPKPPFLNLPDEKTYLEHFLTHYCRREIKTHDGIRVFFKRETFTHAFYESSLRDNHKDQFSLKRAERMDWIIHTLVNKTACEFQGWVTKKKNYDPTRKTAVLYDTFVVIVGFSLKNDNTLKGNFITCYPAAYDSFEKIQRAPVWSRVACLRSLREKDQTQQYDDDNE